MATISALPNELLIEIWRHVLQPADIESFALASKKIHAVSAPFLLEHRDLRYKFTNFYNGSLWSGRSKKSVAGLLKEITINHNVALYVTSLTITSWRDRWDCPEEANLWSRPLRPDSVFRPNIPKLVAFVSVAEESERACPNAHLPYRENDMMILEHAAKRAARVFGNVESLIEGIRGGKEDPIIALLLLQLSNLKHLNIYVDMKEDDYCFRRVLQYVSNAQGTESLKRLINVRLIRTFYTRNEDDLWFVKAFTALPSVKNIECETMENAVTHSDLAIKLHARSSNVETLTFNCGAGRGSMDMDNKDFVELFEGFKALKMFTYDCGFHSRPTGVHTALFAHARHSLETLILRSHDPDKKPLGSFRSFEVLKKLEISHTHLVDDRGPGRTRLAHVLPSSLEELHLHDLRYVASVQLNPLWFGQELLEDKDTCLPKLKIAVDCDDYEIWRHGHKELAPDYDRTTPGIADLQAACNAKGFRLEIPER